MSDSVGLRIDLQRHPFHEVPVDDVGGLRAHVQEQMEGRHVLFDKVPSCARFFGDGLEEILLLDGLVEVGHEALLVRLLLGVGERDGIVRLFREGEVLVRSDAGGLRRAVGVLELTPQGDGPPRWWLTWRLIGTGADGIGQWIGGWETVEGGPDDLAQVPEGFDEWVDVGTAKLEQMTLGEEQARPQSMTGGLCAYTGPAPVDLEHAARILAPQSIPEVIRGGMAATHVFVLSEGQLETYRFETSPLSQLDTIRNLVGRADGTVHAVAVANLTALRTDDGVRRGLGLVVEHDRKRLLLFSNLQPGPDGKPELASQAQGYPQGAVEEADAWIGVPPSETIEFGLDWMQAPGGIPVPIGDA